MERAHAHEVAGERQVVGDEAAPIFVDDANGNTPDEPAYTDAKSSDSIDWFGVCIPG
jgi:hypothetical protein